MCVLVLSSLCCIKSVVKSSFSYPVSEEDILKGKQSIRGQALGNQNSESETLQDGDDDTLSSLEEKDVENLTGKEAAHFRHLCCLRHLHRYFWSAGQKRRMFPILRFFVLKYLRLKLIVMFIYILAECATYLY